MKNILFNDIGFRRNDMKNILFNDIGFRRNDMKTYYLMIQDLKT